MGGLWNPESPSPSSGIQSPTISLHSTTHSRKTIESRAAIAVCHNAELFYLIVQRSVKLFYTAIVGVRCTEHGLFPSSMAGFQFLVMPRARSIDHVVNNAAVGSKTEQVASKCAVQPTVVKGVLCVHVDWTSSMTGHLPCPALHFL